ncbi:MAG: phosphatase PAP2 family protein [Nitrospirae bacterium]|nr:phosphatase PAP2 family protein [Nitrospirota bacterium]
MPGKLFITSPIFGILLLLSQGLFSAALAGDANRPEDGAPTENVAAPSGECLVCLDYGKRVLKDARLVLSSPLRWDKDDGRTLALGTLAVAATAVLLDKPVQEGMQRNRNGRTDAVADLFEPFGTYYSAGVLGGFYLAGAAWDDARARSVTRDGIAASLIASGLITPALKITAGRSRPYQDEGAHAFRPFSGNDSFPSGHVTQAFAVASVIAAHYEPLWVDATAYGIASMVGFARIDHDKHFASDVAAGALIGTAVGKAVVRFNRNPESRLHLFPLVERDAKGIGIIWTY